MSIFEKDVHHSYNNISFLRTVVHLCSTFSKKNKQLQILFFLSKKRISMRKGKKKKKNLEVKLINGRFRFRSMITNTFKSFRMTNEKLN